MLTTSWPGREQTLYFWTMVSFPVVSLLSSPRICSLWSRTVGMSRAQGYAWTGSHLDYVLRSTSAHISA